MGFAAGASATRPAAAERDQPTPLDRRPRAGVLTHGVAMRTAFGAVLAVGVVLVATAARADDKPEKVDAKKLLGKWQPADAPAAVKVVIEFAKEGKLTVEVDFGGKAEKSTGMYKLEGSKLSVTMKKGDGKERSETMTVTKLTDDELVMEEEGKKKSETFKRIKEKDKK